MLDKYFNPDGSIVDVAALFNGPNKLLLLDATNRLPAVDGSQLTNLPSGGTTASYQLNFDTTITASDPGDNNFRADNATPASITNLYLDDLAVSGIDLGTVYSKIAAETIIYFVQANDNSKRVLLKATGPATDNTGWWTVPVTHEDGGTLPDNGAVCNLEIEIPGNAGNVVKVGTPVDGQVGVWTGDGTIEGTGDLTFNPTELSTGSDIRLTEKADHSGTPVAGEGRLWVKNTVPSSLIFTDDEGTDVTVSDPGSGHTIQDNGTPVAQRDNLNFIGFTLEDDAGNNATKITNPTGNTPAEVSLTVATPGASASITAGTPLINGATWADTTGATKTDFTTTTAGRATFSRSSATNIPFQVIANPVGSAGTGNVDVLWYVAKNGTVIADSKNNPYNTGTNNQGGFLLAKVSLDETDYLEIFQDISSGTDTVTLQSCTFSIREKATVINGAGAAGGGGGASGEFDFVEILSPTTDTFTVDLSNAKYDDYDDVKCFFKGCSSGTNQSLLVNFNSNSTSGDYHTQRIQGAGNSTFGAGVSGFTHGHTSQSTGPFIAVDFFLSNFRSTSKKKMIESRGHGWTTDSNLRVGQFVTLWNVTPVAVTSFQLKMDGSQNFDSESRLYVYGRRKTI